MQRSIRIALGLVVIMILLASACMFQLREGSVAVVTRLGSPQRVVTDAGLHVRMPVPLETVYRYDNRKRVLETTFTETTDRDKKNIIILNYAVWNINDPLKFLQAVGDFQSAEIRLDGMITDAKNAVMGNYALASLVSTNEEDLMVEEIEQAILDRVQASAEEQFGVNVYEVAILRLALPEENITRVFEQMRAERQQYATRYRSEGQQQASAIRSATDLQAEEIS